MATTDSKYSRVDFRRWLNPSRGLIGLLLGGYLALFIYPAKAAENFFAGTLTSSVVYHHVKEGLGEVVADENIGKLFLVNPDSVYSEIKEAPPVTNTTQWNLALSQFNRDNHINLTLDDSIRLFANENGLTKARPDIEVDMSRRPPGYFADEERLIVANTAKAGVDGDIFYKSQSVFSRNIMAGARFAVAAQILRDRAKEAPSAGQRASGVRKDVLDRYLSNATFDESRISDDDRRYLMGLLADQLRSTDYLSAGFLNGKFLSPAQFRVARVAAAFRDKQGYVGNIPCRPDGNNLEPEGSVNLCFTNMTDRALSAWYKKQYAMQVHPELDPFMGTLGR